MSLSRILNDEPSPALPTAPVLDPALLSPTQPGPRSPPRPHPGHPEYQGDHPLPPRGYQPVAYQGTGGWDPYSGEWVQGNIFPLGRGNGDYYRPERPETLSSHDLRSTYYREGEIDGSSRKRRREPDEEDDYHAPESRQGRVSTVLI